jgi:phosphoglycolate phosphatase
MFRAVILDWSGTLVDDLGPTLDATNVVLAKFDLPPMTREEFQKSFRLPYSEFYDEVLPGVALAELEVHFQDAFRASDHPVTPLEGTEGFLKWCHKMGIRLFILTSMNREAFESQAQEFGFAQYFEETYSGVLDKRSVILEILQKHGLRASETAYVGDMVHDVETAHHGGVTPVALLSGYDPAHRLRDAAPRFLLSCIGTLHAVMEETLHREQGEEADEVIEVRRLAIEAHVGVPDEERAQGQTLHFNLHLVPETAFAAMADEITATVDYDAVARRVTAFVQERPRKLIETLASEVAAMILAEFPAREVGVEIEKRILPQTECVTVRTVRKNGGREN